MGDAGSELLLRVSGPLPRGQHGDRSGQEPPVLSPLPLPQPPRGPRGEGASPAPPRATWRRGQGGPTGLASSPAPCPLRPGDPRLWVPVHPAPGPGAPRVRAGRGPEWRSRARMPDHPLSRLCSFLRFLQLFFPQSSGPQLGSPGLLLALLARYRCPRCPRLPAAGAGSDRARHGEGVPGRWARPPRAPGVAVRLGSALLPSLLSPARSPDGRSPARQPLSAAR